MFKISVIDKKTEKHVNYLCIEHRYIGNIWYEDRAFKTSSSVEAFIKKNTQPEGYRWVITKITSKCV